MSKLFISLGAFLSSINPVLASGVVLLLAAMAALVYLIVKGKISFKKKPDNTEFIIQKQIKILGDDLRNTRHKICIEYRDHLFKKYKNEDKNLLEINFIAYNNMQKDLFRKLHNIIASCVRVNGFHGMDDLYFEKYIDNLYSLVLDFVTNYLNENYDSNVFLIPLSNRLEAFKSNPIREQLRKFFVTCKHIKKTL
jgi:hypothetical protein